MTNKYGPWEALAAWRAAEVERLLGPEATILGDCDGSGTAAPCGNTSAGGRGCANSSGFGAELAAHGTSSASVDDLAFTAADLPVDRPALLFVGGATLQGRDGEPFGDGLRAVSGAIVRLGVRVADGSGGVSWGPGLAALGGWTAGETRHFQVWYRDPLAGPCGSGFNLSNGLSIGMTN